MFLERAGCIFWPKRRPVVFIVFDYVLYGVAGQELYSKE
jgi:hypothetical protein